MTARYFFGNTLASFYRTTTAIVESTTSGRFDSSFVANSISMATTSTDYIQTMPFIDAASTTTLWTHFECYFAGFGTAGVLATWLNSSGTIVVKIVQTSGGTFQVQYWNGSTFSNIGGTFSLSNSTLYRIDIKLTAGASGTLDVYIGGTLSVTASGMNAAVTNFAAVRFGNAGNTVAGFFSQILGADFDTRDSRFMAGLANANGTYTNGTGTYTDINEVVLDESTSITLTTSGHKKTFTKPSITLPPGYVIDAMCVSGRARANGAISDGKLTIRSSSTDSSSSARSYTSGYEPRGAYFANDPATATRFTQSGYNAAEFGLEAV